MLVTNDCVQRLQLLLNLLRSKYAILLKENTLQIDLNAQNSPFLFELAHEVHNPTIKGLMFFFNSLVGY